LSDHWKNVSLYIPIKKLMDKYLEIV
jgi:hypothetical protein